MSSDMKRITRMVESDENGTIQNTLRVAQSDIASLLAEYVSLKKLDMKLDKADGGYKLRIEADVDRVYEVGKIG